MSVLYRTAPRGSIHPTRSAIREESGIDSVLWTPTPHIQLSDADAAISCSACCHLLGGRALNDPGSLLPTPLGVEVLHGRQLRPGEVLSRVRVEDVVLSNRDNDGLLEACRDGELL